MGEDKYKITKRTLEILKKDWHINCFRIAVLADGKMGFCNHKEQIEQVTEIIDYCIETELYCLVDWHIYYDGNPMSHLKEAKEFIKRAFSVGCKSIEINVEFFWMNENFDKPASKELKEVLKYFDSLKNKNVYFSGNINSHIKNWLQDNLN